MPKKLICPKCGSSDIWEASETTVFYKVEFIDEWGYLEYGELELDDDANVVAYFCKDCQFSSMFVSDFKKENRDD